MNYNKNISLSCINDLLQYCQTNRNDVKGLFVLLDFRLAQLCKKSSKLFFYILIPYSIFYRIVFEWMLGIDLPWNTLVEKALKLYHRHGFVLNDLSVFAENCTMSNSTLIRYKELSNEEFSDSQSISNYVNIRSNITIISSITISNNMKYYG